MRYIAKVECPYCNFKNNLNFELDGSSVRDLVTCDNSEGGCDRDFVVKVEPQQPIVTTREVEGERGRRE